MIETVIALPVFVVVLVAVPYVHALLRAHQHGMAAAREAAWRTALAGCRGVEPSPAGLDASIVKDASSRHGSSKFPGIDSVPLVGSMLEGILPSTHCAISNRDVHRPRLLGEHDDQISNTTCLACNEVATDPFEATLAIFRSFLPD